MHPISRLLALALLAIWLPATQHCGLEAVGAIDFQCASDCTASAAASGDGCRIVEQGRCRVGEDEVKARAPTPAAVLSTFALALSSLAPEGRDSFFPTGAQARPQDWILNWQFTRRAAPPSRAPTLLRT